MYGHPELSASLHRGKATVMLTRIIAIIFGVTTIAVLNALVSQSPNMAVLEPELTAPVETSSSIDNTICERPKRQVKAGDVIKTFARLTHVNYVIQTRYKMAKLDVPPEYKPPPKPIKVSYVIVKHHGTVIRKFDAEIYSPVGNSAEAGFFSLLSDRSDQLIISQDMPRTGVQWVADFSKGFKIIFDGHKFYVGREAGDMTLSDLDGDGIQEIIVPITAFYGFESWRLTTSETPLPDIIFRYDPVQREYLPANPHFRECIIRDAEAAAKSSGEIEKEIGLGRLMSIVLDYVFVGEEQRGWKLFDEKCELPDKARIRSDMQDVLKAHPVYRYIYKRTANR
jgi:hypothetical protein